MITPVKKSLGICFCHYHFIDKQTDELMSRKVQVAKLTNEVSALKSELKLQLQIVTYNM